MMFAGRHLFRIQPIAPTALVVICGLFGDLCAQQSGVPRVVVPTGKSTALAGRSLAPVNPGASASRILYPWKTHVTCTIFWIGETPSDRNPTPNHMSSWDMNWKANFGGFDDPEPSNRIANHTTGEFRPKGFVPKLNPFYVALPYNDVARGGVHRPEASQVIPWFWEAYRGDGISVCKGRWVAIHHEGRVCYAQWEDVGPFEVDHWQYVFGNESPRANRNKSAGIDLSPAVRDFLGLRSGTMVEWRFIDDREVPKGPWRNWGLKSSLPQP